MPSFDLEDTIAAIASPPGAGLRGIIRISGPDCRSCLQHVFSEYDGKSLNDINSTSVVAGSLWISNLDRLPGQLLIWPTRRSYAGQPAAEFHTFGSPPLLKMALAAIFQSGARMAHPGEFTLRAFLSGRLDLTQAEAVLAIIDAQEETQLNGALKQLAGGLSGPLTDARDQLKFVLAELEAGLDFVEEDIEFISQTQLISRLEEVRKALEKIAAQIVSRDHEKEVLRVALIGLPNAGKSSLFNRLLGNQRAIVTGIAGTTTDFLSAPMDIHGLKIELIDTAGLDEFEKKASMSGEPNHTERLNANQEEPISGLAQRLRNSIESNSQLQLLCIDGSRELTDWEHERLSQLQPTTIVVQTKSDLPNSPVFAMIDPELRNRLIACNQFVTTSSLESTGLERLIEVIRLQSLALENTTSEIVGTTVLRAADSLRAAAQSAQRAFVAASENAGEEIVAAEIRSVLDDLGYVVGTVYTDDILDVVFSRFCIGK